jgi:AcrR family transcriptional regulator
MAPVGDAARYARRVPKRGRRPGETKTREAILDAATRSFAALGYDRATVRAIARDAGVDPALVMHFFPTKDLIFAAVMDLPFDAERALADVLAGERDELAVRLVRRFLSLWEDPETGPAMLGLLRSATSYDTAAERLRELVVARILQPIAGAIDTPEAELRSDLVSAQLVGLAFVRYALRVEPIASAEPEALVAALAPTVQRYLTGELAAPPA